MKKINFVVPCYNESGNIELFYKEAQKVLDHEKYEYTYTFINDGSKDTTAVEIKDLASKQNDVVFINFSRNFGKEAAIIAGLDHSLQADATIIIDADLEMPLRYANDMLELWEAGNKLVLGQKVSKRPGAVRHFLSSNFYAFYNRISDSNILQDALDYQLMDAEVVKVIVDFRERKRFFKGITGYIGYDAPIVEVSMDSRQNGSSSFSILKLFTYAIHGIAVHSTFFLNVSTFLGLTTSLGGMLYFIWIIVTTLIYGREVDGWATIVSLLLLFFGMILIILGIIGYYIGLIYEESKGRPLYIVSEKVNYHE